MPLLTIKGVTVDFPFPPYDCQTKYMEKVMECLQGRQNGVLESPTGTGKTLCLLCATLAWRQCFKDTISARKISERLGEGEMFPNTPLSSWGTASTDGDKQSYYTDIPKIIYASRTHSQLAQVINELKNTSYRPKVCVLGSREQLCINPEVMRQESHHVKVHMCRSKVSTRSCFYHNNVEGNVTFRTNVLISLVRTLKVCPYYLSISLKQQADVIFMPYNYMLDPKSRKAHNIDLNGAVVIFDEAHNVEKTCEQSTSFDLTPYDLASAISAVDKLLVEQVKDVDQKDSVSEDFNVENLMGFLLQFKFLPLFVWQQVHIHKDNSNHKRNPSTDLWASSSSSSNKQGNILSYWCFSPGFSMQDLINQGVRCIILTSGTLSPLSSFTSEMRIKFEVLLENSHVIERDQIFVSIIDRGPDGVHLSSAFDRRFVPENMASLGNTVANLSRVVPHGLLVFFPSFPVMEKTLDFWRVNRIENVKPIFVEPKGKGTFTEVIDGFYDKVNDPSSKGGSFFAVCRGKASEGLDFADTFGRGVIITGLPFPPKLDPKVVLKMQFLDEMSRKKYLSGQEWYRQQAFRAVNQAIGRVIRHKEDFGAIFLCDQRFKNSDARAHLPSWIRPYVRLSDSFGNVVRDVSQFFRVAHKMVGGFLIVHYDTKELSALCVCVFFHVVLSLGSDEHSGARGMARICVEYECEMQESHRRPANLLDALEQGDHPRGEECEATAGAEKASRLSTLSLQYDKRMDDELRGGKRKIKLVQEQVYASEEGKASRAKTFLAEMKKSLSQVSFDHIVQALQTYKKTDDLDVLLTETAVLTENPNTHSLLRGFFQFVRPHHKKRFDERCQELTGQGCGYKPHHSLSKDERKAVMLQSAALGLKSSSTSIQLSTQRLNKGGQHLSQQGLKQHQTELVLTGSAQKNEVHSNFLADVKKALPAEESAHLFKAIHSYKKTDSYEQLVSTVVSLFTERDENFSLLQRFGMFIRPHHKKQYKEMLDDLIGQQCSAADVPVNEDQPVLGEGISSRKYSICSGNSKIIAKSYSLCELNSHVTLWDQGIQKSRAFFYGSYWFAIILNDRILSVIRLFLLFPSYKH
uniref:Regulator of telomere elongation helicase 1 n=1 Tax=Gouania willdenowi TaxID=441366 RepID=A0A8C5HBJ2_GOUWI